MCSATVLIYCTAGEGVTFHQHLGESGEDVGGYESGDESQAASGIIRRQNRIVLQVMAFWSPLRHQHRLHVRASLIKYLRHILTCSSRILFEHHHLPFIIDRCPTIHPRPNCRILGRSENLKQRVRRLSHLHHLPSAEKRPCPTAPLPSALAHPHSLPILFGGSVFITGIQSYPSHCFLSLYRSFSCSVRRDDKGEGVVALHNSVFVAQGLPAIARFVGASKISAWRTKAVEDTAAMCIGCMICNKDR